MPPAARWSVIAWLAVVLVVGAAWPAGAHADGDPASDVLASQAVFLPQDGGLSQEQQARLAAVVTAARRAGYPLRVAIVASPTDLGSITELWRQPENYARFLGQELSLVYRGTLLVVMPDGFGFYGRGAAAEAQRSGLSGQTPGPPGPKLGAASITAVQRLAAAAGHPVSVAAVSVPTAAGASDLEALIALAAGALVIILAWAASLRARPLGRAAGRGPGTAV
jgi:hypothetical protein